MYCIDGHMYFLHTLHRISLRGLKMEDNGRFLITLTIGHLVEVTHPQTRYSLMFTHVMHSLESRFC